MEEAIYTGLHNKAGEEIYYRLSDSLLEKERAIKEMYNKINIYTDIKNPSTLRSELCSTDIRNNAVNALVYSLNRDIYTNDLLSIHRIALGTEYATLFRYADCNLVKKSNSKPNVIYENIEIKVGELISYELAAKTVFDAIVTQYQYLQIHPFRDGDTRVSHILLKSILYRIGYENIIYVDISKSLRTEEHIGVQ